MLDSIFFLLLLLFFLVAQPAIQSQAFIVLWRARASTGECFSGTCEFFALLGEAQVDVGIVLLYSAFANS